jgi:CMP-N,N'-diacetyllegionaminic acid synthase
MGKPDLLTLIPARGGSRRLPRKNLALLKGRPLLEYTFETALGCSLLERIVVTSEDPKILELARRWKIETLARPAALASDTAPMEAVVRHALGALYGAQLPEHLLVLQPTSPLRTSEHLEEAIESYLAGNFHSLFSVTEARPHPLKTFRLDGGVLHPLAGVESLSANAQELPPFYTTNGAIYLTRVRALLENQSFFSRPSGHYLMAREESVDIDDKLDLALCETLLSHPSSQSDSASHEKALT